MVNRPSNHEFYDERSLALHRLIAARLREDPGLLRTGLDTLHRWMRVSPNKSTDLEWVNLFAKGVDAVISAVLENSDEGRRIRQSSPLASVIPLAERSRFRELFNASRLSGADRDVNMDLGATPCYHIRLVADANGGIDITIPSFPTVFTQAEDASDAFRNAREAIESALVYHKARGIAYPASDAAPSDEQPHVIVRLPTETAPQTI